MDLDAAFLTAVKSITSKALLMDITVKMEIVRPARQCAMTIKPALESNVMTIPADGGKVEVVIRNINNIRLTQVIQLV